MKIVAILITSLFIGLGGVGFTIRLKNYIRDHVETVSLAPLDSSQLSVSIGEK